VIFERKVPKLNRIRRAMGVRTCFWGLSFSILLTSYIATAQDHNKGAAAGAGATSNAEINFRNSILSKLDASQQAQCMTGESFKQTIKGVTRTRKVDKMPPGYFYGMLASFSKNVCLKGDTDFEKVLHSNKPQAAKDSLKRFQSLFSNPDPLIQNYALMLPLGMIESIPRAEIPLPRMRDLQVRRRDFFSFLQTWWVGKFQEQFLQK
jgi:hypothetical protein